MVTVFTFPFHDGELFLRPLGEKKQNQEEKEEQRTGFVPESPHQRDLQTLMMVMKGETEIY